MLTLNIAIITHKPEGIERLAEADLPRMENVSYVISWQNHCNAPVPEELIRDDVEIHRFDGVGLSNNRNNSIACCTADIIMLTDDDVTFLKDGVKSLIKAYEDNPEVDLITFKSIQPGDKAYPLRSERLEGKLPKGYSVSSIEISFRRTTAGWLRCCPELGLGAPRLHGGEDEILLQTAIRRGLYCCFLPVTVCEHDHLSTGIKVKFSNANLMASGCVIALVMPWTAVFRIPLKAWRVSRARQADFACALWNLTRGAFMAPGLFRRNRKYLW